jgi:SSS family solute:Na+ symporter
LSTFLVPLLLVAVMAASMSTADSNLHALSAVLTRDVYDRLRPQASEGERLWIGRLVIVIAMGVALLFVRAGEQNPDFAPVKYIAQLMFVAIAFSSQALPVAIDMLFLNKGTRAGAIAGIVAGLFTVLHFTPFVELALGGSDYATGAASLTASLKKIADIGCVGCAVNAAVFAGVSLFTRPLSSEHVARFQADSRGASDAQPTL